MSLEHAVGMKGFSGLAHQAQCHHTHATPCQGQQSDLASSAARPPAIFSYPKQFANHAVQSAALAPAQVGGGRDHSLMVCVLVWTTCILPTCADTRAGLVLDYFQNQNT